MKVYGALNEILFDGDNIFYPPFGLLHRTIESLEDKIRQISKNYSIFSRVGHGNGKQKATARANSLCWSLPRCRQDWQQNLEVRSNTFSCRQQKSGLPATLFFAGNKKQSFQATTLSAGNARQFSGNKKSNLPTEKPRKSVKILIDLRKLAIKVL